MDTKWKNRKNTVSFLIFFLGISLMAAGLGGIWRDKPSDRKLQELPLIVEENYQHSSRFREHISGVLETFLAIEAGRDSQWTYGLGWVYDVYYEADMEVTEAVEGGLMQQYQNNWDMGEPEHRIPEEEREKYIQKYYDAIKGNKNLLYAVYVDGEQKHANFDFASCGILSGEGNFLAKGSVTPPDGYGFLLYFDGEKVRIFQDGVEQNVYGDGYYQMEDQWYLPGYSNFPAGDEVKKIRVCMAAAREPMMYMEQYQQVSDDLYWMANSWKQRQDRLKRDIVCLGMGAVLFFLSFLTRKGRREAEVAIVRFQGRMWLEFKLLLLFALPLLLLGRHAGSGYGYELWQETEQMIAYGEEYGYTLNKLSYYLGEFVRSFPVVYWSLLFWGIYLVWNDLRYNKRIWRQSLTGKILRKFSARQMGWPPARRMARRTRAVFGLSVFYGLFMISARVLNPGGKRYIWVTAVLLFLGTVFFLAVEYLVGVKNMETAREMEELSRRISDIRRGDYGAGGGTDSGTEEGCETDFGSEGADLSGFGTGDLDSVLGQLEDIRHGMKSAVDEQMRSERMKVELIANVSHDIKTPLTSIISYVQFLKQEENLPDHVKDYVKILDEKSQRLKNMVQDVFAVSKAASGELPMHMEELDFGRLLQQTLADMEEQIGKSQVRFRMEIPDGPILIMADGQRMYRVFQNLFQNALQYSLSGSRVYVSLKAEGNQAAASVKNTSSQELKKGMDFAERFARGDQSRTDGGSGLGLSIAQSFTEACGGEFRWETNADLFVVTVTFSVRRPGGPEEGQA